MVGGSSPPASSIVILGGLPERPKGAGCKPAGIAYVGSNPTPSTDLSAFRHRVDASPHGRPVGSGQVFVCVWAGFDASRLRRPMAARCRVRRFVVGVRASLDDRDLVFQDFQGVAGSACASRAFGRTRALHSLLFLGGEGGRAGRLASPGAEPSFIRVTVGDGPVGRMGAVGVFVGVAGVVAGMGHNRRLARGGGSSGLPLRVPRGSSSIGRASAFQAERRGFESLLPLYNAPTARRIGWPT